jgi:hypothetical protein
VFEAISTPDGLNQWWTKHERRNVALVRASLGAMDSKDTPAFFSRVSEDITVDELILAKPFVGKDNAKRWFEAWVAAVPDMQVEVTAFSERPISCSRKPLCGARWRAASRDWQRQARHSPCTARSWFR